MVWFQCEDCGENLKKPKLPNHFRQCYATKLSCIDCGQVFGRNDVEGHTQCITEMEKYGPKGVGKGVSNSNGKGNSASKPKPDIDLHVGLSLRAPWSCSLCNTTVTSQQTLFAHAEGKKHIAKAKGYHAKMQPKQAEVTLSDANGGSGNDAKNETPESVDKQKEEKPSDVATNQLENGTSSPSKKRKASGVDTATELGNGEVIQVGRPEAEDKQHSKKKVKGSISEDAKTVDSDSKKEDKKKEIKWKKLITSSLKSNSDGSLKLKKLIKLVSKSLKESGNTIDEGQVPEILEQKIRTSSRFAIDGKYVRLAVKNERYTFEK